MPTRSPASTTSNRAPEWRRKRRWRKRPCASCAPGSKDPAFEFGLPLAPAGTHFQRRVWARIAAIPSGQTLSYGEVAAAIGSGPRAVGNACGANPYPIVVPCHRVVAANHGLGGFARNSGGFLLDIKKWLLRHEHAGF
jgi:methylated-DNA-[protein]-cysteine S-methyltransferase